MLRSQVRRGRIEDAVRTAKRARLRSIEYEQKLVAFLETTRRDIGQVNWVETALGIIDEAREHISERLEVEREILAAIETRRELETTANSTTSPKAGAQLAALEDTLNECLTRHAKLHQRLIRANADYLVEHDRQAFRPQLATPLPDLEAEVLSDALELPTLALAQLADELLARCQAPRCPPSLRLGALVERLPVLGLGDPCASFGEFRQWLRDTSHRHPETEIVDTSNQRNWRDNLEKLGIDTELFRYQLQMNQREGAADELFRFGTAQDFIDFFLELTLDREGAEQLAKNIEAQRETLRKRPEFLLEPTVAANGAGRIVRHTRLGGVLSFYSREAA